MYRKEEHTVTELYTFQDVEPPTMAYFVRRFRRWAHAIFSRRLRQNGAQACVENWWYLAEEENIYSDPRQLILIMSIWKAFRAASKIYTIRS